MQLEPNPRYDYSALPLRPVFDWPEGRRLAIYVGLNLECFGYGHGLGAKLVPSHGELDVLNYAWRDYGNRVGVWRLLELFERMGWPCTALVNSEMYEQAIPVMEALRGRGDEIAAHGRSNAERQGDLEEAAERSLIAETTRVIATQEGTVPGGWLGPWISQSHATLDLLAEAGYRYCLDWCHDDQPTWMRTRHGPILSVPYPQELNDIPQIVQRQREGSEFADMIIDGFDVLHDECTRWPLVMGIALHPYLMGHPHRLRHLHRAFEHIERQRDDRVWITTAGAIDAHFRSLFPAPGAEPR